MSTEMADRLVWLLERFQLRAEVFDAGPLHCGETFNARPGQGFVHVLESGRLRVVNRGRDRHTLEEPSVFLYLNPVRHRLEPLDDRVRLVCASFSFGLDEGNPLQQALTDMVVVKLAELPALARCLEQLFAEAAGRHCGRQAILDRLIEVCLILLLRELMDQRRLNIGLLAGLSDPKLVKAINAMHAEPAANWTLERLARLAGMSRARFADHFREVVGMTPGAYLGDWRLGLAQSMLLKDKPVRLIADEVGYASASALSRAFAARCGLSPSAWRKSRTARP
jgi:AraC-like DNA-binding protein